MVQISSADSDSDEEEKKHKPLTKEEEAMMKDVDLTKTPAFQDVFQQAAKMKTAQLKAKRQTYEAAPEWFKATMFADEKTKEIREGSVQERLDAAMEAKAAGNALFGEGKYEQAVEAYVKGITFWKYFKHEKGNDFLPLISGVEGVEEPGMRKVAEELLVHCFLNVAASLLKLSYFDDAIYACNEVLKMDDENVKALYRRGLCQVGKDSAVSLEIGVKDLHRAHILDPSNAPLAAAYQKQKRALREQDAKDKATYGGGLKKSGGLYSDTEREEFKKAPPQPAPPPLNPAEMKELKRRQRAEKKAAEKKKWMVEGPPFTKEHIEDAANEGIDLNNPLVVKEIKKIRNEMGGKGGVDKMKAVPEDGEIQAAEGGEGADDDEDWVFNPPFGDDIKAKAKEMGLDLDDPATVKQLQEVARAKKEGRPPAAETKEGMLYRIFDRSKWLSLPTFMYMMIFGNTAWRMYKLYSGYGSVAGGGKAADTSQQWDESASFDAWDAHEEF